MKRAFAIVGVFSLGALFGALLCWFYFNQAIKATLAVGQDVFASAMYNYEIKEARLQAKNPNHEVAIYALNRALTNLQIFKPSRRTPCRVVSFEIATLHVNVARIYREIGNVTEQEAHLKMALNEYAKFGWQFSNIEELKQALPLIENNKEKEAVQKYGKGIEPECRK
jgi:tetratricopeptide (TPR) repeat protein